MPQSLMELKFQTIRQLSALMVGIGEYKKVRMAQVHRSSFCARDYGATRGFANESEFTVVKVCKPNVMADLWLRSIRLTFTTTSKHILANWRIQIYDHWRISCSKSKPFMCLPKLSGIELSPLMFSPAQIQHRQRRHRRRSPKHPARFCFRPGLISSFASHQR